MNPIKRILPGLIELRRVQMPNNKTANHFSIFELVLIDLKNTVLLR
jgi:hypothetical protein